MTAPNKHSHTNRATVIWERPGRLRSNITIVGICCLSARRFPVFVAAKPLARQPGCYRGWNPDRERTVPA